MAIISKTNREGVDTIIEGLQQKWYAQLLGLWESGSTYQMYPRANKNYREDQVIPEVSLDQKDYSEVLMSDKFDVTSFFLVNNEAVFDQNFQQITQSVSVIFQADLVALYAETERMDNVFDIGVLRVIKQNNKYIHGDILITTGVDDVYRDLSISGDLKAQINVTDISDQHVVKFTFDLVYKPNCNVTLSSVCEPVTLSLDTDVIASIASGDSYNITLEDIDGNPVVWVYDELTNTLTVQTGAGSFTYDLHNNGSDSGSDVVINGSNVTIKSYIG